MPDMMMNIFLFLALHLERENIWNKDVETIEKLFSQTEKEYIPHNVIGIQFIESVERIDYLNNLIFQKNERQKSNTLMVYRYYDIEFDLERVCAYCFDPEGLQDVRKAICKQDESGCWYMCFEEDYLLFQRLFFKVVPQR